MLYRFSTTIFIDTAQLPTPSLTFAQLSDGVTWPAAAHNGEQAFCSNARVGGQGSGAGTGSFVMASGGTWWTMAGTAMIV